MKKLKNILNEVLSEATMSTDLDTYKIADSFTPSELTESSAIHGDFDQASLNYSGHQNLEVRAETLGKDSCCCGATKSKPCACMKTGAKCSGSCACSTKEAEYNRPTPKWAKPLGLIGGLAAGYISAQMIDNAKE